VTDKSKDTRQNARFILATLTGVGLFTAVWLSDASADFVVRLDYYGGGTNSGIVVTDNSPGDVDSTTGELVIAPIVLGSVTTNVNATSTPGVGGVLGELDFHNMTIEASSAGVLIATFEATSVGAQAPAMTLMTAVTGTLTAPAGSTLTVNSWVNPANMVPALGPNVFPAGQLMVPVTNLPPAGSITAVGGTGVTFTAVDGSPQTFAQTFSTSFSDAPVPPFALFGTARIMFTGPGTVSFTDHQAVAAPAPGTIVLLGAGLAGLAAARRKLRRRRS